MGRSNRSSSRPDAARLVRRHRRLLAGAAAAASIAALGMALQPPAPATRGVVVAAADLPAGRSLVAGDLAVAQVPAGVLPAGTSSDPGGFLGRALAAPMARGEAMAGHRLTDLAGVVGATGHDAPARAVRRCWGSSTPGRWTARGCGRRLRARSRGCGAVRLSRAGRPGRPRAGGHHRGAGVGRPPRLVSDHRGATRRWCCSPPTAARPWRSPAPRARASLGYLMRLGPG